MGKRPLLSENKPSHPLDRACSRALSSTRVLARSAAKWVHLDSNQGPAGYEPDALTAELWTRGKPPFSGRLGSIPFAGFLLRRPLRRDEGVPCSHQGGGQHGRPPRIVQGLGPAVGIPAFEG